MLTDVTRKSDVYVLMFLPLSSGHLYTNFLKDIRDILLQRDLIKGLNNEEIRKYLHILQILSTCMDVTFLFTAHFYYLCIKRTGNPIKFSLKRFIHLGHLNM